MIDYRNVWNDDRSQMNREKKSLSLFHPNVWDVVTFDSIQASILPIESDGFGPAEIDSQQQTTDQSNCLFEHPCIYLYTFLQFISV